jgi:hypothetical protein
MKELWKWTFELFRKHIILWVPCSIAGILMLAVGRLRKAEIHWLLGFFGTRHSALGGLVPSAEPAQAQHRAMMVLYPLGFLIHLLEVCLFVVALTTTMSLVQMVLEEKMPDMVAAVRKIVPRWREVLLFSLKYMAVLAVVVGLLVVLPASSLTPERFHEFVLSKVFIDVSGLVGEGCLAWLLMPTAIRLLRPLGSPIISAQERTTGTVFAVTASAGSLVLQFLVGKAEIALMLDNQWQGDAIAVVNTVIINMPQVLLFIALALLAMQRVEQEAQPVAGSEMR